jgi:hypothetical protein
MFPGSCEVVSLAAGDWQTLRMGSRQDCRHYSTRSVVEGEVVQRCRLGAAETMPFGCPDGCIFFEARPISEFGWQRFDGDAPQ